jgi:transposase
MLFPWKVTTPIPKGAISMSTSLLYHAFGLKGYDYVRTEYTEGTVVFTLRQRPHTCRCPQCDSRDLIHHGHETRSFKAVPIGRRPVRIVLPIPRVECRRCQIVRQVTLPFADPRRRYTRAFERYALELSRLMTIQDVAQHLGVSWDTIKDIVKRDLQRRFKKPRLGKLKQIAIDEISVGHGHRYLTVVLNLETGAVVFVGEGKGAEALDPFWGRLRAAKAQVEAVATDMSLAYIQAVREHLGDAVHVFDHFHVIKLFNEKLSDFRRELHREATEKMDKEVLKGTRWLLLKNPENLDPKKKERERLEEALRMNQPLATVYYLKEDLRQLWMQPDKETGVNADEEVQRRADQEVQRSRLG